MIFSVSPPVQSTSPVQTFGIKPWTVDSVLLAALEQFKYQATDRLLLAVLEEYEQHKKDIKKTPAKMVPSTLSNIVCVLYPFLL